MTLTPPDTEAPRANRARPAQRLLGGSLRTAWVLVRVAVVVGCVAMTVAWRQYGYVPVAVQTGSMAPTLPVHELLFVHDVPAQAVRVGDVITFDPPGRVPRTTHRVVKRELHEGHWYFHTKGDANPVADDWRQPGTPEAIARQSWVRGVTYADGTAVRMEHHLPHLGWLAQLGTMPRLRKALFVVPFLLFGMQLLAWIWSPARERRSDDGADAASEPATLHRRAA